jgi:subtilisin-like proprotein convertase family protein
MRNTEHSSNSTATKRLLASSLSVFLILTLVAPAWAVVFSNTATINLPDALAIGTANSYPSNITVAGLTGNITNVTVRLENLNHTFPDDLDVLLVAPNGNNILLMSDVGGGNDVYYGNITFDDAAAAAIPDGGPVPSGTVQTSRDASADTFPAPAPAVGTNTTLAGAFNGIAANGTWSLYIVDDAGADQGILSNGWSITITTAGSAATTFRSNDPIFIQDASRSRATPYPSAINVSGLTGAVTDVNVTINGVNHLNPDDLDIMLISPAGKRMLILSDAGGADDVVNVNLTFDDSAAAAIPTGGPIVAGTFRPSTFDIGDTMPFEIAPHPQAISGGGTATLASVFNGTEPNGFWRLLVVDDATGNSAGSSITGGWSIDITAGGTYGAKRFTSSDFDGDGKTDTAVYRRGTGFWFLRDSFSLFNRSIQFGAPNDSPIPGDYDGDRRTDLAVTRVSGSQVTWYILRSGSGTLETVPFGAPTDRLVPADYDGDGRIDVAVWRPSQGAWYIRQSNGGGTPTLRTVVWGASGDIPLRGHFEGTNGADFTVFRPANGTWYIRNNADTSARAVTFGAVDDQPVPGDYDADGKTDIAVWRGSDGSWSIIRSSDSTLIGRQWGATGDVPVQGDYDGDSATDITVFRPSTGAWYILNSGTLAAGASTAALRIDVYGCCGDLALPYTYNHAAP